MRLASVGIAAAILAPTMLLGAAVEDNSHKPLRATYSIYSRDLGDTGPPTDRDAKLNIQITGDAARRIYTHMGARSAIKDYCDGPVRSRGDLICWADRAGKYGCGLGINLKTGKTVLGVTC